MTSYHIAKNGKQTGPFEEAEVLRQILEGTLSPNDFCWREGMADWQPIAVVLNVATQGASIPPIPDVKIHPVGQADPLFLHISVARLILMSIVSFGLYDNYWMYKNWRYIKERDNMNIRPFWRGFFGVFYCHSLLRRIYNDKEARSIQVPSFSPDVLATVWVVLIVISAVVGFTPGIIASIIGAFIPTFLCLVPIQNYVNAVSKLRSPRQPYYGWSSGHILCLVLGIMIWVFIFIELITELSTTV
jgi:GYF domain 2